MNDHTPIVEEPDPIQQCIENFTLEEDLESFIKLGFLHYISGSKNNPYRLRRSKIIAALESELNNYILNSAARKYETHFDILQNYIKYFNRDYTLLNMIINYFSKSREHDLFVGEIKIDDDNNYPTVAITINKPEDNNNRLEKYWILNQSAVNNLMPDKYVSGFFKEIYNDRIKQDTIWINSFEIVKAKLFGKIENQLPNKFPRNYKKIQQILIKYWDDLSAIQSSLLYFKGAYSTKLAKGNNISSSFVAVRDVDDSEYRFVVSISCPQFNNEEQRNKIGSQLKKLLTEINQRRKIMAKGGRSNIFECINLCDSHKKELQSEIGKDVYRAKIYEKAPTHASDWMILLTQYLYGQKHEGNLLDFYLVCGELSEFRDSNNTDFRRLSVDALNELSWLEDVDEMPSDLQEKAETVATKLSKEHYPWFEDGRHALLWNIASYDNIPKGLVSLKTSSWRQIINDRFNEKLRINIPDCALCYVKGEQNIAGFITIVDSKPKEIMNYSDGEWNFLLNSERERRIKKILKKALNLYLRKRDIRSVLNRIIDIIIRIADNPMKGGTLIFVSNECVIEEFKSMGNPWIPNNSPTNEDIIALVSQDGATLCAFNPNEWEYRRLLMPDVQSKQLFEKLENHVKGNPKIKKWPLESKGSRRWSAAITTFKEDVLGVIVISQDGDIQIWTKEILRDQRKLIVNVMELKTNTFEEPLKNVKIDL